jgi:hypothetical protein
MKGSINFWCCILATALIAAFGFLGVGSGISAGEVPASESAIGASPPDAALTWTPAPPAAQFSSQTDVYVCGKAGDCDPFGECSGSCWYGKMPGTYVCTGPCAWDCTCVPVN